MERGKGITVCAYVHKSEGRYSLELMEFMWERRTTRRYHVPGTISPSDLYHGISSGSIPFMLDVRNQDEFAAWPVEGTKPVPTKNVPVWLAVEQVSELAAELPSNTVVICARGNGSAMLLEMLAEEGVEARSLEGGTAAWAELLVPQHLDCLPDGMVGWQVLRPSKACISYVIGIPGKKAVVVDPARYVDLDRKSTLLNSSHSSVSRMPSSA